MNKYLAGYLFAGETIFGINTAGSATPKSVKVEPDVKLASEPLKPAIPAKTVVVLPKAEVIQKPLLLIVNSLSDTERAFLAKILISVKQNIADAEIVEIVNKPEARLAHFSRAKEIISFGIVMNKLGSDLLLFPYQIQLHQSVKYLFVDDLQAIQSNQKDEKRLLWAALKNMYQL
jgi:hypothetical protein